MTEKKTTRRTRSAATQSGKSEPEDKRIDPNIDEPDQLEDAEQGVPNEHFRGERRKPGDDAGSLEEETLDRDAPYNKTYGR